MKNLEKSDEKKVENNIKKMSFKSFYQTSLNILKERVALKFYMNSKHFLKFKKYLTYILRHLLARFYLFYLIIKGIKEFNKN